MLAMYSASRKQTSQAGVQICTFFFLEEVAQTTFADSGDTRNRLGVISQCLLWSLLEKNESIEHFLL